MVNPTLSRPPPRSEVATPKGVLTPTLDTTELHHPRSHHRHTSHGVGDLQETCIKVGGMSWVWGPLVYTMFCSVYRYTWKRTLPAPGKACRRPDWKASSATSLSGAARLLIASPSNNCSRKKYPVGDCLHFFPGPLSGRDTLQCLPSKQGITRVLQWEWSASGVMLEGVMLWRGSVVGFK